MHKRIKPLGVVAAMAITPWCFGQGDPRFVPIDFEPFFNAGAPYEPVGPLGEFETAEGIPFQLGETYGSFWWSGDNAAGGTSIPQTLDLAVGLDGALAVHMMINTAWGQRGPTSYLSVEFYGDQGAYYRHDLVGNVDVRDWRNTIWTNVLDPDGIATNVWSATIPTWGAVRLDVQRFELPPEFETQTLESIVVTDTGRPSFQRALIAGATIELIPCKADIDGDGALTIFDFIEFQILFVDQDPRADCDGNGIFNLFDFLAFQIEFDSGCN